MSETATAELPRAKEITVSKAFPSTHALFQEGSKIVNKSPISFTETVMQLNLPQSSTINEAILRVSDIDGLQNDKKVKLAIYASAHDALKNPSQESRKQALNLLIAEPELRGDIIAASQKENTQEEALQKDINFVRENGGVATAKLISTKRISQEEGVSFALAFQTLDENLSAVEKAQIINSIINSSNAPIELSETIQKISNLSHSYSEILKSIMVTLPARDRQKDLIAFSSLAGPARTASALLALCQDKDKMLAYFGTEKRNEHVPHEISKLTEVIEIVRNKPEITTVSFDLYDTLVQWTSNQGERRGQMNRLAAHLLKSKYKTPITPDEMRGISEKAWARRWNEFQKHGIEVDIKDTLGWMVDDLGGPTSKDPALRTEAVKDLEKLWYKVELDTSARMPEAQSTLKALKDMGKKICLTSNASWSEAHVRRVLKRFGLEEYFDAISLSNEQGKMKHPTSADFFHNSWSKVGATPQQVLHVGDDSRADFDGARFAGAKATRYNNPNSFAEIQRDANYWKSSAEYSKKAYEFFTKQQNREALAEISALLEKRGVPQEERERVTKMAKEVYQKSRDVVGPAYVALGDQLLTKLSTGEADLVMCLARDGLPFAVAQKLLLYLEPDRYPGAKPEQIRYVHVSRKLLDTADTDEAFRRKYIEFVNSHGVNAAQKIILTDLLAASGRTHKGMRQLLHGKEVEGRYMDTHMKNDDTAHSFLKDSLNDKASFLVAENMLLLMEALYSGPFQSAVDIKHKSNGPAPVLEKKSYPPEILAKGLSEQSLLLLNHLAIIGIQDAVRALHRRRLLNMADMSNEDVMKRYYSFIASQPPPIWQDIWRSTPWQDNGKWHLAEEVETGAVRLGKI